MTSIHIVRDYKRQIQQFEIEGHANAAEYGEDIVCASISILSQGIINGIEEVVKQNIHYKIDPDKGWIFCNLPIDISKEKMPYIQVLLETMVINLKQLAEDFPQYVSLKEEEV